jgi:hypothetical protein
MQLVMITQYFDTIKSIGEMDKTNTLFLSHSPTAVRDISERSCSRCWSRTGRRASAIGLPSPLGPFSIDDWGKRPMRPRITVNLTAGGKFEIWLNEQGRDLLVQKLQRLGEKNDHFHLGPKKMGEVEVASIPYRSDDEILEWGKVLFRTDAWDRQYFSYVVAETS